MIRCTHYGDNKENKRNKFEFRKISQKATKIVKGNMHLNKGSSSGAEKDKRDIKNKILIGHIERRDVG